MGLPVGCGWLDWLLPFLLIVGCLCLLLVTCWLGWLLVAGYVACWLSVGLFAVCWLVVALVVRWLA